MKKIIMLVCLLFLISISFVSALECSKLIEATSSKGPVTLGSQGGMSKSLYGDNLIIFQIDKEDSFTSIYNLKTNEINDIPREYYVISGNDNGLLLQNQAELTKDISLSFYDFNAPGIIEILTNNLNLIQGSGEIVGILQDKSILYINTTFSRITSLKEVPVYGEGKQMVGKKMDEVIEIKETSKNLIKFNPYTSEEKIIGNFESTTEETPKIYTSGPYDGKIYFTEVYSGANVGNYYVYDISTQEFNSINLPKSGYLIDIYKNKAILKKFTEKEIIYEEEKEKIEKERGQLPSFIIIDINTNKIIKNLEVLDEKYINHGVIAFSDSLLIKWIGKLIPYNLLTSIFSAKPYLYDLESDMTIGLPLIDAKRGIPPMAYYSNYILIPKETDIFVNLEPSKEGVMRISNEVRVSDIYKCSK